MVVMAAEGVVRVEVALVAAASGGVASVVVVSVVVSLEAVA